MTPVDELKYDTINYRNPHMVAKIYHRQGHMKDMADKDGYFLRRKDAIRKCNYVIFDGVKVIMADYDKSYWMFGDSDENFAVLAKHLPREITSYVDMKAIHPLTYKFKLSYDVLKIIKTDQGYKCVYKFTVGALQWMDAMKLLAESAKEAFSLEPLKK
jgi:hypothetical protein